MLRRVAPWQWSPSTALLAAGSLPDCPLQQILVYRDLFGLRPVEALAPVGDRVPVSAHSRIVDEFSKRLRHGAHRCFARAGIAWMIVNPSPLVHNEDYQYLSIVEVFVFNLYCFHESASASHVAAA